MESHLILVFSISTVLVTAVLGQGVHLEFNGKIIPNNSVVSYYDIKGNGLSCVTQRKDCCSSANGPEVDWFTPSGKTATPQFNVYISGLGNPKGYVEMLKKSSTSVANVQEGLYHCNIPAPNGDISTLYVGIYTGNHSGKPTISGITYHQLSPEVFTLTCTSTGGPATNVTWTLNCSIMDANHVLTQTVVNTTTAEYNNTLTVTGREPGNYQCTVSNARGSDTSQMLIVNFTGGATTMPSLCSSSHPPTQLSTTTKSITTVSNPSSSEMLKPTAASNNQNPSSSSHSTEIPTASDTRNPSLSPEIPTSATTSDTPYPSHSTEISTSITTSDTQNPSLSPEIPTPATTSDTPYPSSSSHSTEIPTSITTSATQNPSSSPEIPKSTTTSDTPTPSSVSQLLVIAGAAAGLTLCIILIAVLVLILVVYKRRKGTRPRGKKTQGPCSLQQIDDTRSSVNQNQTSPSTGQTLTAQTTDDAIKNINYNVVNTTSSPQSLPTIMDSIDPLYSAVTDIVTPSADPLHSSITKPPIPMECVDPTHSLLTHDESDQTERNEDESTFTEDTKQEIESKAEDKPIKYPEDNNAVVDKSKKVKHSAQSESRADPVTMETVEPAEANAVYAAVKKKVKKKDRPPPLPAPYQDEL